ncbi:group II intron maturase-specific domain-containing protein [Aidingimonas lacisalsi]|uniref:group II intron maturase-specific domain-containing protein n=1 Tax=Aidingimonas lacisalsi TaxID=2604086 RepID=UPI0038B30F27
MHETLRRMNINRATWADLRQLADWLNPMVRGWVTYYGKFYPQPLERALVKIDLRLGRWARNKYKRLRGHKRRSWAWVKKVRTAQPTLFVHREFVYSKKVG